MAQFTSRRIAACFAIAAAMAIHPALAADFSDPPGPGPEEAGPPPDYPAGRGPARIYREERFEEAPPPRADRMPYGPRYAAGPQYAPPPPPRQEECRTIVRHRVNAYGEEVRRRIRICDEVGPIGPGPRFRPSAYGPGPVPPADIPEGPYGDPRGY